VNAILEAAELMCEWIEEFHADEHDLIQKELGIEDLPGECKGCLAARKFREAKSAISLEGPAQPDGDDRPRGKAPKR
jgi:hypothetical protein